MRDETPSRPAESKPAESAGLVDVARLQASEEDLRTENEHLREALLELERVRDNYFELYDLASVALVALDSHCVIQNVNKEAAVMFAHPPRALVGHMLHTFVHVEDRTSLNRHLLACKQLINKCSDLKLRLAGGSTPVRLKACFIERASGTVTLITLFDDRDNVQAAQEKQKLVDAEQRARHASESKDQFIAVLSHELRTPLTPILAASSMLKEDPKVEPALRRVFERIERNARAEARLIDDLLDASGIVRGKVSIVSAAADVHELLLESIDALRPEAGRKAQHISVALDAENAWIAGDALRLRQVFTNLLRNAIKFTPVKGSIQVRSWNGKSSLMVEVDDSGIGFSPESARRIFQPFDQLQDDKQAGGLGLGLAIAKGLVELHQGKIDAASRGPGKGARFVVELPLMTQAAPPAQKSEPLNIGLLPVKSTFHVLLVEDNEDTAELLSDLLQLKGYDVVVAHSVAGALAKDNPQIEMVISDLGLPDGTGMDLIRQLQNTRRRPAIALSGFGMESDVQASKQAGFDVHLIKPVTAGRLMAAIQSLTQHN